MCHQFFHDMIKNSNIGINIINEVVNAFKEVYGW